MSCIYKTTDGDCELHSDGIEYREPCVEGPCDDEAWAELEAKARGGAVNGR